MGRSFSKEGGASCFIRLFGEENVEDAEIVGRAHGRWVVESSSGRRYFLHDHEVTGPCHPEVGVRGKIGYVQGAVTARLTFVTVDGSD